MSTSSSSSFRDRLITVAALSLMGLAVAQGGYVAYRLMSTPSGTAARSSLPPDAKDFRGRPLPSLASLRGLNGAAVARETSAPVTIVAMLRTTCPACNVAKPVLESLKAEYGDRVGVVGVFAEDAGVVEQYGATYPSFVDADRKVWDALGVRSVPQFLVVRDGKVVDQIVGYSPEVGQDLEAVAKGVVK